MDAIYYTFYVLLIVAALLSFVNIKSLFNFKYQKLNSVSINGFTFWMQRGYQQQTISYFYMTSVVSSTLTSFVFGKVLDTRGRKFGCLFYCCCAAVSNALKIVDDPVMIVVGQILGGISNAALYTSFEAWLVGYYSAKEMAGYTLTPISDVYAVNTLLSAIGAISSGVLAHYLESHCGPHYPFIASILLLIIPFWRILKTWPENKGEKRDSILQQTSPKSNSSILYIVGLVQLSMETCLNVVILVWTPTLAALFAGTGAANETFPFGLVFSTMMAGLMAGSQLFQFLNNYKITNQAILVSSAFAAMISFLICFYFTHSFLATFVGFVLFECSFGIYMPAISVARSKVALDGDRGQLLNNLRIPINLVCIFVYAFVSSLELPRVFLMCGLCCVLAQNVLMLPSANKL